MEMFASFYMLTKSRYHFSVSATVRVDKIAPKTLL